MSDALETALEAIRRRPPRRVVFFTGAGVSAESGIPTFRGAGGLWRNFRAEDLATPEAFARDPKTVWEFNPQATPLTTNCTYAIADTAAAVTPRLVETIQEARHVFHHRRPSV